MRLAAPEQASAFRLVRDAVLPNRFFRHKGPRLALASTTRAAATSTRDEEAADNLGKSLASLFLLKEENVPAAKQSMGVFQVQC